jgi:hypothetical protein
VRFAAFLLAAVLSACGGGGGSSPVSGTITPAPAARADLLFGYYYGASLFMGEMVEHTNLAWSPATDDQMAMLTQAKGAGIKNVVLALPAYRVTGGPTAEPELRFWLQRLANVGLLEHVVAVYPIDEPDTVRSGNRSDAEVTAQNALLRKILPDFGLPPVLAVIYACDTGRQPGFASYDWVGCDHYPSGCGVLTKYIETIRGKLAKGQRLLLVPGGADPWRQDPACFESYADLHSEVVAIVPFVWQTVTDQGVTYTGIRENPTKALYVATGKRIKG